MSPSRRARWSSAGCVTPETFERLSDACACAVRLGTRLAAERGLILVDTKYELGRTDEGEVVFIDEIHTPDSSRYWYADSYEAALATGGDPRSLDKEYVRRKLVAAGFTGQGDAPELDDELRIEAARRYIEIFEQVTGRPFTPDLTPPKERIRSNCG